jgi:macrolide transport system ATP-binding/permease protein
MDEPTNHLDLLSVECMEEALGEFPGAMILVSHDQRFLDALITVCWEIETKPNRSVLTSRPYPRQR